MCIRNARMCMMFFVCIIHVRFVAPALLGSPLPTRYKGTVAMSRIPDGRELQVVYCEGVSADGHQKTGALRFIITGN